MFLPNFCLINLQDGSIFWHVLTSRVESSVDPDQLASQKPADLDLHCFQNRTYQGLASEGLMQMTCLKMTSSISIGALLY